MYGATQKKNSKKTKVVDFKGNKNALFPLQLIRYMV